MANATVLIATSIGFLVLFLSPVYGLIAYTAALIWYPSYLTVQIGTVDFNVSRIVIIALYAALFLRGNVPKQFKLIWLDKLVLIFYGSQIIAAATNTELMALIENRAGSFFDLVLPYFAVRMIITNMERYASFLKGMTFIASLLAIVAFYESITGNNPVGYMLEYHTWSGDLTARIPEARFGFHRAQVTFSHPIMLGMFFAMLGGVCSGFLLNVRDNTLRHKIGFGLLFLGVFSTMSSGPLLTAILVILFMAFYRFRRYWKIAVIMVVVMSVVLEIVSNRHFFEVIDRITISSRTAWYRSRLIEVALFEGGMSGYWLTGFGFVDPGWGANIDMRSYTDMVNHYLLILSRFGIVGFIPFCGIIATAILCLYKAFRMAIFESDRWFIWCLGCGLLGLLGGLNSVSLFGQPRTVFFMILGFSGAMPLIVTKANSSGRHEVQARIL